MGGCRVQFSLAMSFVVLVLTVFRFCFQTGAFLPEFIAEDTIRNFQKDSSAKYKPAKSSKCVLTQVLGFFSFANR